MLALGGFHFENIFFKETQFDMECVFTKYINVVCYWQHWQRFWLNWQGKEKREAFDDIMWYIAKYLEVRLLLHFHSISYRICNRYLFAIKSNIPHLPLPSHTTVIQWAVSCTSYLLTHRAAWLLKGWKLFYTYSIDS